MHTINQFISTQAVPTSPSNEIAIKPFVATVPFMSKLGLFPFLSLTSAIGVLLVAVAYNASRVQLGWAEALFWMGLVVFVLPIISRLAALKPTSLERLALVVVLGLGMYLIKVMYSPELFTFHDELQQWRTTNDILQSNHLFSPNSILPFSPKYPGLNIVTASLVKLTGVSIFSAGLIVVGVAHVIMVLTLYLLFERITNSARAAGLATVIYAANPNFIMFDSQFAYESLALPLAAICLLATVRLYNATKNQQLGLNFVALTSLSALIITHHLTSFEVVAFLLIWALIQLFRNHGQLKYVGPVWISIYGLVLSVAWLWFAAKDVVNYLSAPVQNTWNEIINILFGQGTSRQLFQNNMGAGISLWQQLLDYAAIVLILLALPFALRQVWQHYRNNPITLTLGLVALSYPFLLATRLTSSGLTISGRSASEVFLGLGSVLAIGASRLHWTTKTKWKWRLPLIAWLTIIFLGGASLGVSSWGLPGPYQINSYTNSVEPQGLQTAQWMKATLGPNNRLAADRINLLLAGSYGEQTPITGLADQIAISPLFLSPVFGPTHKAIVQTAQIRYLLVDHRFTKGLPVLGHYYELNESGALKRKIPLDPQLLSKFDNLANVSRIFDSGDITIYDLGALTNAK